MEAYAIPADGFYTLWPAQRLGTNRTVALYSVGCRGDRLPNPATGYALLVPTFKNDYDMDGPGLRCQRLTAGALQVARAEAVHRAQGRPATLCRAVARGSTTLYQALEQIRALGEAEADAIPEACKIRNDGELVEKLLNPRVSTDLDTITNRLSQTITHDASKLIKPLLRKRLQSWSLLESADFADLTPTQMSELWLEGRDLIHTAVDNGLGLAAPGIQHKINLELVNTHNASQKFLKETHLPRTQISFRQVDQDTLDQISTQSGWWIRGSSGKISKKISNQGRGIIAEGIEQGIGRKEIASRLVRDLPGMYSKYGFNYARTVAAASISRARSYSEASSYSEAGIEYLEVMAMLDERTTDICRSLDGTIIQVQQTLNHIKAGAAVSKPEDISKVSPFMREWDNPQSGKREIWITGKPGTKFATVQRSGKGNVDDRGMMSKTMGGKDLPKKGVSAPPYHYL